MDPNTSTPRLLFVGVVIILVFTGVGVVDTATSHETGSTATAAIDTLRADTDPVGLQPGTTTTDLAGTASIAAEPNTANATAIHRVTITIENGSTSDLSGVVVDYSETDASVSLAVAKVKAVTLSGRNISESAVPSSLNGETVRFAFGPDRRLEAGDTLSIVYGGVRNPSKAGTYSIEIQINPTNHQTNLTAQLNVSEAGSAVEAEATNDNGVTADPGKTDRNGEGKEATAGENATGTTTGSGPGLTVLVTVVCMLVGVGITWRLRA